MHNAYKDIMALASGQRPLWWDQNGVPRFAEHHPDLCPNIYANEVCLLLIACQACSTRFKVQMSWRRHYELTDGKLEKRPLLAQQIEEKTIHYGDPPNVHCCPGGATMNCDDLRVLEYWRRNFTASYDWQRMPELEIDIEEPNT